MKCEKCKWWEEYAEMEGKPIGLCRKRPPESTWVGHCSLWPRSFIDDWCGEYCDKYSDRSLSSVANLILGVRARNALNKLDITTIGQVKVTTNREFLVLRNIGRTTVREIRGAVLDYERDTEQC